MTLVSELCLSRRANNIVAVRCTVLASLNFNPAATHDDGSCIPQVPGCMDTASVTYQAEANTVSS